MSDPELNRVESILAFMEWLYQQPECVRYMVMHNCEFATDLVKIFTDTQGFDDLPRDGYINNVVWPNVIFKQTGFSAQASQDVVNRIEDLITNYDESPDPDEADMMAQQSPSERWN